MFPQFYFVLASLDISVWSDMFKYAAAKVTRCNVS